MLRLRLEVEPAGLEAVAECMVERLVDKVVEVGQLVVERLVAADEQLRVVARCRHSGNFYRAPLVDIPVSHEVASLLRVPLFIFIVFVLFIFLASLH